MEFATIEGGSGRIALILTPPTLRRLTPGLRPQVGPGRDFGWIDIGQGAARIVEALREMGPAGIIMEFREELTEQVSSLGFPVVVVLADMLLEGMGCVNVDDEAIGEMAADYLRRKGLRSLAYCGMESEHAPGRKSGFLGALEDGRGGAVHEVVAGEGGRSRRVRLERWLGELPRPAGIFAAHDPLAREILEACGRLGLGVPAEVALLSASNDPFTCELVYPGISSVEIPWGRVGLEAGRLIGKMLAGEEPGEPAIIRPVGINTRGSTDFYRVSDRRIQEAVAYMRRNLGSGMGVGPVVRHLGMDRRALERLFRARINRSPGEVLADMRTERARELLEQGSLRIGEIAEVCGFGTSERLAAAFKRRHGLTPRSWRKRASA